MRSSRIWIIAVYIFGLTPVLLAEELYTVSTSLGDVIGLVNNISEENTVTTFLGIPFAEPPVGNLRFKKPVPITTFSSPVNATSFGPICAQYDYPDNQGVKQSEDCLFLNVYVPYNMSAKGISVDKKSVMIWIYGGGFVIGDTVSYDGSLLSSFGDVIVVTIGYRLAAFGFLTTNDDELQGNLGLWDQHLAIQWVHDHITAFGGDPGSVTIFGESAGSASVVYQCFYSGNLGLFQRAIAQSGSLNAAWAYIDSQQASQNAYFFAETFGCPQSNTADMVECLRQVPSANFSAIVTTPVPLSPVNDGVFVRDTAQMLMSGQSAASDAYTMFQSIDLMIGFTNADGLVDIATAMALLNETNLDDFVLTKDGYENVVIPFYLRYFYNREPSPALKLITINEYTDWRDPNSDALRGQQYTDFSTDWLFAVPATLTANLHTNLSTSATTYMYEFAVRPIDHLIPVPASLDGPDVMNHADDIIFVFGQDLEKVVTDSLYSFLNNTYRATMTLWTNFAKSGNPNSPNDVSDLINSTWPQYSSSKEYIKITTNMSPESIESNPRPQAVNFWNNIIPSMLRADVRGNISRDDKLVRVTTPVGEIIGVESYVPYSEDCGFRIQTYLGIPFAKAATGELRFQKPVAREPFTAPFNATQFGPSCYQVEYPEMMNVLSEDCLSLNVYVPANNNSQQGTGKAVLVWIYGGGFQTGESIYYDPRILSTFGDVIVVTLNYRISYYGFMTTGDNVIPSNIGLWDQHFAIKWVHDNINAFGGDENRITIFGESAGSASAIYQSFYPGNRGLFQRAIAQSGTSGSPWAYFDLSSSLTYTRQFARKSGCPLASTSMFLQCLQNKTIEELQTIVKSLEPGLTSLPSLDNDFILDVPDNILSGRSSARAAVDMYHSVDLMIGFTNSDGLVMASDWFLTLGQTDFNGFTLPRSGYEDVLIPALLTNSGYPDISDHGIQSVIHEYTDWSDPDSEDRRAQKLVDLYTEMWYAVPSVRAADFHALSNAARNTYMYEFSVRPVEHLLPVPALFDGPGVMNHGDEIAFVMGSGITNVSDSDQHHQQLRVYQATMTMWSNFAKTGDPNMPNDITKYIYTTWPKYSSSRHYLEITEEVTQAAVKQNPRLRSWNFWTSILPVSARSLRRIDCLTTSGNKIPQGKSALLILLLVWLRLFV